MTRALVISEITNYLKAHYSGPVAVHGEIATEMLAPPYLVVRVGSSEQLYPGQAEIWDMNIFIGVFHDADVTAAADAETQAGEVFAMLEDPAGLEAFSAETLVWSALERLTTEASNVENRWQHIAAYHGIVARTAPIIDTVG